MLWGQGFGFRAFSVVQGSELLLWRQVQENPHAESCMPHSSRSRLRAIKVQTPLDVDLLGYSVAGSAANFPRRGALKFRLMMSPRSWPFLVSQSCMSFRGVLGLGFRIPP